MKKKYGPLPLWAWGLLAGVVGYYLYKRYTENQAATTSSSAGVLDPNAIDPNTGLTYGQEENAALNAAATSAGGGGSYSGANPTQSGLTASGELTDFESLIQTLQGAGIWPSSSGTAGGGAGSGGSTTPAPITVNQAPITVNVPAATPAAVPNPVLAPITGGSPSTPPSVNVNQTLSPSAIQKALLTAGGIAGSTAQTFLSGLVSGGYKKLSGTTQTGGLAQTGTYTRAGAPTYYVWGTSTTGLHVRQAVSSSTGANAYPVGTQGLVHVAGA